MALKIVIGISCCCVFLLACLPFLMTHLPPRMDGASSPQFRNLAAWYRRNIESWHEKGSSFVAYVNDEKIFDMNGGYSDLRFRVRWNPNTLTPIFGSSNLPVAFTMGLLKEKSILNETSSIKELIEAFPSKTTLLTDLLRHKTGFAFPNMQMPFRKVVDDAYFLTSELFNEPPTSGEGTTFFHFHTLDIIFSDIVTRLDEKHRTLSQYFLEEVVWPNGIDLQIGSSPTQLYRIARTYHESVWSLVDAFFKFDLSYLWHSLASPLQSATSSRRKAIEIFSNYELSLNYNPDLIEVPLSSVNLFTNARALVQLLNSLLPSPGKQVISAETAAWMLEPAGDPEYDPVLRRYVQYTKAGLFMEKSPEGNPIVGIRDDILGQIAFVDPARNLTFAYVTNHAHGCSSHRDTILQGLVDTLYECL